MPAMTRIKNGFRVLVMWIYLDGKRGVVATANPLARNMQTKTTIVERRRRLLLSRMPRATIGVGPYRAAVSFPNAVGRSQIAHELSPT